MSEISLTPRERTLLEQLTAGHGNKTIAFNLGLAEGSVKVYLSRLFRKLHVNGRLQAALWATRNAAAIAPAGDAPAN